MLKYVIILMCEYFSKCDFKDYLAGTLTDSEDCILKPHKPGLIGKATNDCKIHD